MAINTKPRIEVKEQYRSFSDMGVRVVTADGLRQENIQRRLRRHEAGIDVAESIRSADQRRLVQERHEQAIRELQDGKIPRMAFPENFRFADYGFVNGSGNGDHVFEATVNQGSFGDAFSKRLEYEVDAGRDENPLVYQAIYDVMTDANFPKTFDIHTLRGVGVALQEVKEGSEVKFAQVGNDTHTIRIVRYAAGIGYTYELFEFNYTWQLGPIEREFGKAVNAKHNDIHMSPILTANYTGSNAQSAVTIGNSLYEAYANTIDQAIVTAQEDNTNPRKGPYVMLCNPGQLTSIERAMGRVPQQGFNLRPSNLDTIRTIVAYSGWANTMGKKAETYSGVTSGDAYLIHVGHREFDFQSKIKTPLRRQEQNGDLKRFIMREVVFDTQLGVYAAPTRAVTKITLPTTFAGPTAN